MCVCVCPFVKIGGATDRRARALHNRRGMYVCTYVTRILQRSKAGRKLLKQMLALLRAASRRLSSTLLIASDSARPLEQ